MIGDIHVFDCVIHAYDMSDENLSASADDPEFGRQSILKIGTPPHPPYRDLDFAKRWEPEDLHRIVFEDAPTDRAMAQVVPVFDWFENYFAPIQAQYEMAQLYPDEVMFCGGTDPAYRGLDAALDSIEYQIRELGARSIKFYNGHLQRSWACDDPEIAYPMYQKCLDLGVNVIQFHKGLPFGKVNVETMRPNDLQAPARDFPEMTFIVHHLALPYFDELLNIGGRFPNVYLALSGNLNFLVVAPRLIQEQMGRLLMEVGSEKLLWGSEAALAGGPAPYLDAFIQMQIPEDLQDGYGYPALTEADRRAILGENFARIMGVDLLTGAGF